MVERSSVNNWIVDKVLFVSFLNFYNYVGDLQDVQTLYPNRLYVYVKQYKIFIVKVY